jgi:hypothetical protein
MQFVYLSHDQLNASSYRIGKHGGGRALGERMQLRDSPDTLRRDQSKLGKLAAQGIDQRGTLTNK